MIGENKTFTCPEAYLKSRGVEIVNPDNEEGYQLKEASIKNNSDLWNEDIGEEIVE